MKHLAMCALLAISLPASAQFGSIDLGKALDFGKKVVKAGEASRDLSPEEEVALGEGITSGILGASPLHPDANLQRYVNRVGKWLALHTERADLPWTFAVIDTETINAFAMPGGSVVVSHGLLKQLANESELAAVLSHEIAHVLKKHQLTALRSGAWSDLAGDVGKEFLARKTGGSDPLGLASQAKQMGVDLVKNGAILRPLDRSMEYEADQMAVVIAARSGYDPYGLVAVMQMLAQTKGENDGASIFSTHPPPGDRIAELEKFMPAVERYASQPQLEGRFKKIVGP